MSRSVRSRVLVVDDEVNFCRILAAGLEKEGYQVITAYDGKKAVEKVKEIVFDVVVMDERMPEMSGLKALEIIRTISKELPVIFMTAYDTPELRRKVKALKVDDYLVKPFNLEELVTLTRKLVKPKIAVEARPPEFLTKRMIIFEIYQLLRVEILSGEYEGKSYYSRIEDKTWDSLMISRLPLYPTGATLAADTVLSASFVGEDGLYCFETTILADELKPIPRLILAKPNAIHRLQRRRYPRAEVGKWAKYTVLRRPDTQPLFGNQGLLGDISISGAKLIVEKSVPMTSLLEMQVELSRDKGKYIIERRGEVIRVEEIQNEKKEYGLGISFIGVGEDRQVEGKIMQYVLRQQA